MTDDQGGGDATRNKITGGTFYAPVTLARDVTMQVAGPAPQALAGLPAAPTGFVGRTHALQEVLGFLDPAGEGGAGMLVSAVAGMAGVGKTALALMAAHQAMEQGWFGGGVFFIDLRGYTPDPGERVPASAAAGQLLRAMGIRDTDLPPTGEEQLGLYRSVLADRAHQGLPVLVVADNAAVTGQVEPLLPAQPCHRLLITSRHTLTLPAQLVDLAVLPEAESLDLLRTALQAGRADPRAGAEPEPAKEIARRCGQLPLALQIIAALLRAEPDRTLAEMATELADTRQRLDALDSGDRDQHGRPLAVRAAFDLSYQHLLADQPEQAQLFRLLALNPGPDISLPAAAALTGTSEPMARRQLAALARAHLLTAPVTGRWGMHDLVRLYADQHGHAQAAADDRGQALDRLLDHYLSTAWFADAHLRALPGQPVPDRFTGRDDAMAWFDTERANLVTAVTLAQSTARHHIAHRLPADLNAYLSWRRGFDDLLAVNAIAVTASVQLGDRHGEGQALNNLGLALCEVRHFEEAITVLQDAVAIYREVGDRHKKGRALNNLGLALREVRRFDEAITSHQDAVAIFREFGDRHGEGMALNNLGLALREVRRFEEAITVLQDVVAIYREVGDRHKKGRALNNLGLALREVRRFDEAITAHQDAVTIYREFGDRQGEGMALGNLGIALGEVRRYGEAITVLQDAVAISREVGDRHGEGKALDGLGIALREVRRYGEAITVLQDAVAISREVGDRHGEGKALDGLGIALREVRRYGEAITVLQDAVAISREVGDRHGEGKALDGLGIALREVRRYGEAITAHQDAVAISREVGDRHGEGMALNNLGIALHEVRRFDEAITAFKRAMSMFDFTKDDYSRAIAQASLTETEQQQAGG
ncbi:tetratricopeptide repeat protein [Nonomuraea sp. NEAU-A123]|uniref:tetratricopeptide repeat protein n=1 Tax=Nonomuraea sp. NEAU-A123 TaxID=2839649 RepID=UPI001BE4BEE8|nr:tetratricopeptide repeat protein [Nonomuraea sp. NEAU-A123]MBT2235777.1 tetratricopeptide repeat protein [Nonomuraea sp. NEAU-A123]